ncbi:MAG: hypothetical protein JXA20_14950 [Spirochaetes bacterium]|nr:hypothetical protein [Spirochaetota bacterium]
MKKSILVIASAMLLFGMGCGGGVQYRDASTDKGGREWGPKEINETTRAMVDSIYDFLKNDWKGSAIIRLKRVQNKSSQHVQTKLLSDSIITSLVKKKIAIEEDDFIKDTLQEIEKSQAGLVDENYSIPVGTLRSPNFLLSGTIHDNVRYEGRKEIQYIVVTFKLTNLATGQRAWSDQKEFYKVGSTRSISF